MSQTPRERVIDALNHREPERVPFALRTYTAETRAAMDAYLKPTGTDFGSLVRAVSDVRSTGPEYIGPEFPPQTDYWGLKYKTFSYGTGEYQEFDVQPLAGIETVEAMDAYPWADPDWFDYQGLREKIRREGEDGKYAILAGKCYPFERFTWMTGMEETMMKLILNPEVVHRAFGHITDFFCEYARRILEAAGDVIDMFFTADDVGSQNGPLISPQTYRDMIMPYHKRIHDVIHGFGTTTVYHTDGSVVDLLPDLIEAGVDFQEAVQVDAAGMDPEVLKSRFGDVLGFHGGVSVQQVLPRCSVDEVRAEVAKLKRVFGAGGGYICAPTHAIQVGTPCENVIAMIEEAVERPLDAILRKSLSV